MNRLHYSPPRHWMNDPNGLVFHDGRYHLYFQYNPYGVDHGNLSWGHASSTDLVNWEDHPVAIWCDEEEDIFSGSIVVDTDATSGFGTTESPAFIALYTSMYKGTGRQAQSLAYSLDEGMTWTKYQGNPVLDRESTDFRDPKVMRWTGPEESYWVMATVEALHHEVLFYRSDDLRTWTHLSTFGPEGAAGGVWECPDLFPLQVEGTDDVRWVLIVSLSPGGVAGGSGTQYFVGDFDGTTFTPDEHRPLVRDDDAELRKLSWLDHGHDNYAGVTFAGLPDSDRTLIAWMNNWNYARETPAEPARGAMTLPRRLSLVERGGRTVIRQVPVVPSATWTDLEPIDLTGAVRLPVEVEGAAVIELTVRVQDADAVDIRLRHAEDGSGGAVVRFDARSQEVVVDRTAASGDGIHPLFTAVGRAPRLEGGPLIDLQIVLDDRSIEVFADDGTVSLTELIYPETGASGLSIEPVGGSAVVEALRIGAFPDHG